MRVEHHTGESKITIENRSDGFYPVSVDRLPGDNELGDPRYGIVKSTLGGPFPDLRTAARFLLVLADPMIMVMYLTGRLPDYFEKGAVT